MCAPLELSGMMESPSISRFNSRSSNRTFDASEKGPVSPAISPLGSVDGLVRGPIVQTGDNRQWIDLNTLSPKFMEELRRQYEPTTKYEPSGPLGKGSSNLLKFPTFKSPPKALVKSRKWISVWLLGDGIQRSTNYLIMS